MREYYLTIRATKEAHFIRAINFTSFTKKCAARGIDLDRAHQVSSYPVKDVIARVLYIAEHDSVIESCYGYYMSVVNARVEQSPERYVNILKEMFNRFPQRTPLQYAELMYDPNSPIRTMVEGIESFQPKNGKNKWPKV